MNKRLLAVLIAVCLVIVGVAVFFIIRNSPTKASDDTTAETEETTREPDVTEPAADNSEPQYINPLTGLGTETDVSKLRPVSIMVNNIYQSLPQEGVSRADILYECLAEGGITRLMLISNDYEKLGQIGSVRSARDYYIDYAESYNCIFIHAGGSDYAYDTFAKRGTDHIDGVRGSAALYNTTETFVRDPERLKKYSSEHTLMVKSGAGIKAGIEYMKIPTEKAAGYEKPMNFAKWGTDVSLSDKANHAKVVMSSYQTVDYVYSPANKGYLRYQYNGERHIDSTTGEQLCFRNVIVMFTETGAIPNDAKARIWVGTTGEGSGWYLTDGGYKKIIWKKENHDSPITYFYEDGTEVELNRGKTMINVVPSYNSGDIVFDNSFTDTAD